jgi:hypothetical protein
MPNILKNLPISVLDEKDIKFVYNIFSPFFMEKIYFDTSYSYRNFNNIEYKYNLFNFDDRYLVKFILPYNIDYSSLMLHSNYKNNKKKYNLITDYKLVNKLVSIQKKVLYMLNLDTNTPINEIFVKYYSNLNDYNKLKKNAEEVKKLYENTSDLKLKKIYKNDYDLIVEKLKKVEKIKEEFDVLFSVIKEYKEYSVEELLNLLYIRYSDYFGERIYDIDILIEYMNIGSFLKNILLNEFIVRDIDKNGKILKEDKINTDSSIKYLFYKANEIMFVYDNYEEYLKELAPYEYIGFGFGKWKERSVFELVLPDFKITNENDNYTIDINLDDYSIDIYFYLEQSISIIENSLKIKLFDNIYNKADPTINDGYTKAKLKSFEIIDYYTEDTHFYKISIYDYEIITKLLDKVITTSDIDENFEITFDVVSKNTDTIRKNFEWIALYNNRLIDNLAFYYKNKETNIYERLKLPYTIGLNIIEDTYFGFLREYNINIIDPVIKDYIDKNIDEIYVTFNTLTNSVRLFIFDEFILTNDDTEYELKYKLLEEYVGYESLKDKNVNLSFYSEISDGNILAIDRIEEINGNYYYKNYEDNFVYQVLNPFHEYTNIIKKLDYEEYIKRKNITDNEIVFKLSKIEFFKNIKFFGFVKRDNIKKCISFKYKNNFVKIVPIYDNELKNRNKLKFNANNVEYMFDNGYYCNCITFDIKDDEYYVCSTQIEDLCEPIEAVTAIDIIFNKDGLIYYDFISEEFKFVKNGLEYIIKELTFVYSDIVAENTDVYLFVDKKYGILRLKYYSEFIDINIDEHLVDGENSYFKLIDDKLVFEYNDVSISFNLDINKPTIYSRDNGLLLSSLFYVGNFVPTNSNSLVAGRDNIESSIDMIKNVYDIGDVNDKKSDKQEEYLLMDEFAIEEYFSDLNIDIEPFIMFKNKFNFYKGTDKPLKSLIKNISDNIEFDNVFLVLKNKFLSEWVKISSLNFNDDNVREPLERLLNDLFEKIKITSKDDDVVEFFGDDLIKNEFKDEILTEYFINLIKEKKYYSELHEYLVYDYFNNLYINKLFLYVKEHGDDYAKNKVDTLDFGIYNDKRELINLFFYVLEINGRYKKIKSHIPIDGFQSYNEYLMYSDLYPTKQYEYLIFDVSDIVEMKDSFKEMDKIFILKPLTNDGVTNNNLYRFLDIEIPLSFVNLQDDEYNEYENGNVYRYIDYLKDTLKVLQEVCIEKGYDFYKINMKIIKWFVEIFLPQMAMTGKLKTYQDFVDIIKDEVNKVDDINDIILFNKIKDYLVIGDFGNNINDIYKSILENYDIKNSVYEILDIDEEYKEYVDKLKMKSEVLADFCLDSKLYDVITKVLVLFTEDVIATSMLIFKMVLNIKDGLDDEKFLKYEILITKLIDKFLPFHTVIESFIYLLYIKETSGDDAISKEIDVTLGEKYLIDALYRFYEKIKIYVSEYSEAKIDILYYVISERFRKVFFDASVLSDYLEFINGKKEIGKDLFVLQDGSILMSIYNDETEDDNVDNIKIQFSGELYFNNEFILNVKKEKAQIIKTSKGLFVLKDNIFYKVDEDNKLEKIDDIVNILKEKFDEIFKDIDIKVIFGNEIDYDKLKQNIEVYVEKILESCNVKLIKNILFSSNILSKKDYEYNLFVFIKYDFGCFIYNNKYINYNSLFTDNSLLDLPMDYDENKFKPNGYDYGPFDMTELEEPFYYVDEEEWRKVYYNEEIATINPFLLSDRTLIPRFVAKGLDGHDFEKKVNVFSNEYLKIKEDIFFRRPDKVSSFFVDHLPTIDITQNIDDELSIETLEKNLIRIDSYFEINRLSDEDLLHDEFPYDIEDEPDESIALIGATDFMHHIVESYFYDKIRVYLLDKLYMFANIEYDFGGKIAHDTIGYDEKYIYLDDSEKLERMVNVGLYDELEYNLEFNYRDYNDIKIEDDYVYVDVFNNYYDYMKIGTIEKLDIYINADIHSFNYDKVKSFEEFEHNEYYHNSDEWRNIEFILSSVAIDKLKPIRIDIRFVRIANVNELSKYIKDDSLVRVDDENSELQKTIIEDKLNFIINIFEKDEIKVYLNDIKIDYAIHSDFLYDTYGDIVEGIFDERYKLNINYSYSELIQVVDKYAEIVDTDVIVDTRQEDLLDLERDEYYKVSLLDKYYVNVFIRRKPVEREKTLINDYLKEIRVESDDEFILKEFEEIKVLTNESLKLAIKYYENVKIKINEKIISSYLKQITKEKLGIDVIEKLLYGELFELDKDKIEIITFDRLKELWYGDILKDSLINVKFNEQIGLDMVVDYEYDKTNEYLRHDIGGYEIVDDEFLGRNVDTILKDKLNIETAFDLYDEIVVELLDMNDIKVIVDLNDKIGVELSEYIKYYIDLANQTPYNIEQYDYEKFDYYGHMYSDSSDIGISVLPIEKIYISSFIKDKEYLNMLISEDIEYLIENNFGEKLDLYLKKDVLTSVFVDSKYLEKNNIDLIEKLYIEYSDEIEEDKLSIKAIEDLYYGLKLKDRQDVLVNDNYDIEVNMIFKDYIRVKAYDSIVKKIDDIKDYFGVRMFDELINTNISYEIKEKSVININDKLVVYREDVETYYDNAEIGLVDKLYIGYGNEFKDNINVYFIDQKLEYGKGVELKDYIRGYFRNYLFFEDKGYENNKDLIIDVDDKFDIEIKYNTFVDSIDIGTYERVKYGLVFGEELNIRFSEKIVFGFDFKVKHNPYDKYSYDDYYVDFLDNISPELSLSAYLNEKLNINSVILLKDGIKMYSNEKLFINTDFEGILDYIKISSSETNLYGFAEYDYVIDENKLHDNDYMGIYPFDTYPHDTNGYITDGANDKIINSSVKDNLVISSKINIADTTNNLKQIYAHFNEKLKYYLDTELIDDLAISFNENIIISDETKELKEKNIKTIVSDKLNINNILKIVDKIITYFGEVKNDVEEKLIVDYDDGKLNTIFGKKYKYEEIYEEVDEELIITLIKYFYYENVYANINDKLFAEIKDLKIEDINSNVSFNKYEIMKEENNGMITMFTRIADNNQIFIRVKLFENIKGDIYDLLKDVEITEE